MLHVPRCPVWVYDANTVITPVYKDVESLSSGSKLLAKIYNSKLRWELLHGAPQREIKDLLSGFIRIAGFILLIVLK